jgi:hypothetical protein
MRYNAYECMDINNGVSIYGIQIWIALLLVPYNINRLCLLSWIITQYILNYAIKVFAHSKDTLQYKCKCNTKMNSVEGIDIHNKQQQTILALISEYQCDEKSKVNAILYIQIIDIHTCKPYKSQQLLNHLDFFIFFEVFMSATEI